MLLDRSKYKFYGRSQLVRLRGKYTVQTAHCAMGLGEIQNLLFMTQSAVDISNLTASFTVYRFDDNFLLQFLMTIFDDNF